MSNKICVLQVNIYYVFISNEICILWLQEDGLIPKNQADTLAVYLYMG